jgi:hypothetical protein
VTQATVWGIDAGWAFGVPRIYGRNLHVADGTYDATLAIDERWVHDLAVTGPTSVSFPVTIRSSASDDAQKESQKVASGSSSDLGVPDLTVLPAWQVGVRRDTAGGTDQLAFAATIWNTGTGPFLVKGSRTPGSDLMPAYQYIDDGTTGMHRVLIGSFHYELGGGHDHWHLTDVAEYSLLDRGTGARVRSTKVAFCTVATDPIDLTVPDAVWNPAAASLQTSCGMPSSLTAQQVLPVGWGDTYQQVLAGQSFDLTGVPNGRYAIEVVANPTHRIIERSSRNNASLREIELGGTPGARTVRVLSAGP